MAFSRSTVVTLSSPFGPSSDKAGSKRIMHFVGLPMASADFSLRRQAQQRNAGVALSGVRRDLPG